MLPKTYPTDVNDWNGSLDHVQFLEDFVITDFDRIHVEVDTSGAALPDADDNTYKPVVAALHNAADNFSAGMRDTLARPPINSEYDGAAKILSVRLAITEMNPGSQAARFWVGLGAGQVVITVKGDVVDERTGRYLLHFNNTIKDTDTFTGYEDLLNHELRRSGASLGKLLSDFAPH